MRWGSLLLKRHTSTLSYEERRQLQPMPLCNCHPERTICHSNSVAMATKMLFCLAVWLVKEQVAVAAMDGPNPALALQLLEQIRSQFPNSRRADRLTVSEILPHEPLPPHWVFVMHQLRGATPACSGGGTRYGCCG